MNGAGGAPTGRRRVPVTLLVLTAVTASLLWWSAAGRIVAPGRGGVAAAAPTALAVQAATGGSVVVSWAPPADGSRPASYPVRVVAARGGRVVAREQSWSLSASVGGLEAGVAYRVVVGAGPADATSAPVTVLADARPDPPTVVTAVPEGATNALAVRWTPAPTGVAASGAIVQLYDGAKYVGYLTCQGCTTAAFHGIGYGRRYTVKVVPTNSAGPGLSTPSRPLKLADPCPLGAACVTVDGTAVTGPARHRAAGFLNSFYPIGDMLARARALAPFSWRGAPRYRPDRALLDWSSWDAAIATGAQTTLVLSNLWQAETTTGAGAKTPWSDWEGYRRWVTATVRTIESSGRRVSYWEIQNEAGGPRYYSPSDFATSTPADYLQQFLVAYQGIKAADPDAAIIGPSLSHFADYPGQYDPHEIDLVTFLDFAASHGLRLAAVTWHEIDDTLGPQPRDFNNLPQGIEDHVAEVRRLVADRPALGHPEVGVNEYGRRLDYAIPAWTLGEIAALEGAKVDRAGRSCWPEPDANGAPVDDCAAPTLDGLLGVDGSTPHANFWVYANYARMTADLLATTSSDDSVSVLAGRDTSGQVIVMVGRHVTCLPGANLRCAQPAATLPAPAMITVAARLPGPAAGPAHLSVARIDATWGPVVQPAPVHVGPARIVGGVVTVVLPAVADGEVDIVTLHR